MKNKLININLEGRLKFSLGFSLIYFRSQLLFVENSFHYCYGEFIINHYKFIFCWKLWFMYFTQLLIFIKTLPSNRQTLRTDWRYWLIFIMNRFLFYITMTLLIWINVYFYQSQIFILHNWNNILFLYFISASWDKTWLQYNCIFRQCCTLLLTGTWSKLDCHGLLSITTQRTSFRGKYRSYYKKSQGILFIPQNVSPTTK